MSNLDAMIENQMDNETHLANLLSVGDTPVTEEAAIQESNVVLECDENGVFPDDEEDDAIEKELGVL